MKEPHSSVRVDFLTGSVLMLRSLLNCPCNARPVPDFGGWNAKLEHSAPDVNFACELEVKLADAADSESDGDLSSS